MRRGRVSRCRLLLAMVFSTLGVRASDSALAASADLNFLPPTLPWHGASETLALMPNEPWATPCEASRFVDSPDYESTVEWLWKLTDASDRLEMVSLGKSPQQREIWAVILSTEGAFTAEALRSSRRPLLLAQAGIHSGEIDGKDAGMMLLRDLTVLERYEGLVDGINFVFVPIFSVDAHEHSSEYSRMNQRGPRVQGWRTNARNLNLNRDYTKADTPEMRAMLAALTDYDPDLYVDIHVTDGADYQYDITYGFNGEHGWSPHAARWMTDHLRPAVDRDLTEMGHIPGPLIFVVDGRDITQGSYDWTAGPRFSNGYGDARHLPTILVENHSLKPYRQRVLGTYVFLRSLWELLADQGEELMEATAQDRAARPETIPLSYKMGEAPPPTMLFRAVSEELEISPITGRPEPRWTGRPYQVQIPILAATLPDRVVSIPKAYVVPAAWADLAPLLDLHGIDYEVLDRSRRWKVERDRLPDAEVAEVPFEGHMRVVPGEAEPEVERVEFAPGSLVVPTDQPGGILAALLFEPQSQDSFLQWGFFLEILQRAEYFDNYVMEPMARSMMREDPELAAEFETRLMSDATFAGDARARLDFFYERTPYFDRRWKLYPVGRLLE